MNYYGGKELAAAFRTVRENTIKIAEDIPENKFDYRPAPDTRTVAELLAHIGASTMFQSIVHGSGITDMMKLNFQELFQKFTAEETRPRSKAELLSYLKNEGDKFASFLEGATQKIQKLERGRKYLKILEAMAAGRPVIDQFFEKIMVMHQDPSIRKRRLLLLGSLFATFSRVADISEIVVSKS